MNEILSIDQLLNLVLIAGQAEKEIFLIPPLQRLLVDGAEGILGIGRIILEFLATNAKPPFLTSRNDVSGGLHPGVKLIDQSEMAGIGGPNKAILADTPAFPEVSVALAYRITVILRTQLLRFSGALNLLPMFIDAGDKDNGLTIQALIPR